MTNTPPGVVDTWGRGLLRSPLLPVAVLFTLGVVLDRLLVVPLVVGLFLLAGALLAWGLALRTGAVRLSLVYLAVAFVGMGLVRHHVAVYVVGDSDLAYALRDQPVPVQVLGRLEEEPQWLPADGDVFRSRPMEDATRAVLAVEQLRQGGDWRSAQGRILVYLAGRARDLHLGDEIEATGMLVPPPEPGNPGETDRPALFAERGLRGQLYVAALPGAWQRRESGWHTSLNGWLAILRGRGQATLAAHLPAPTAPLAMTLLLGDGAPVERSAWERYIRTGIIAVLAISGQHLVILAAFLEFGCRLAGWRQRRYVGVICLLLFGYALLSGGRPPALRAAIVSLAFALAILLRRRGRSVNVLALAWLTVGLLDPSDLFNAGCQFSFLAVAVLIAYPLRVLGEPTDPLDLALEQSDPAWWQMLRSTLRWLLRFYLATLILWLVLTPLTAWHYHLIAPAGILLGPPLTALATIALFLGFALLLLGPSFPILAPVLAWPLDGVLRLMQYLIDRTDPLPGAWTYLPDLTLAGVLLFYAVLFLGLASPRPSARWRVLFVGGPIWLALVLLVPFRSHTPDELRVTFLSVGHGGCVVLELPDGRVLLYDAGSLRGPIVASQQIAPYLWSRGIGRIDEVFLSHADLDHFNGLPALLDRFPIGRVSTTPSFGDKPTAAVRETMARLHERGLGPRILIAGQTLDAGGTTIEVLHPPPTGPPGNENTRSLVLRISFAGRSVLLTGDLEGAGLERVLASAPQRCEVLMYPHHGSKRLDPTGLVRWARPGWLIACQGAATVQATPDAGRSVRFLSTQTAGAITFRGTASGWSVETFRSEGVTRPGPPWG
jgi:competence protein ComEC